MFEILSSDFIFVCLLILIFDFLLASKALDCLLESPWAKTPKKGDIHFSNRDAAINFMGR